MVIGARNAALIRNYRSLGFRDVFEPGAWVPLASGGGLPHQHMSFFEKGKKFHGCLAKDVVFLKTNSENLV